MIETLLCENRVGIAGVSICPEGMGAGKSTGINAGTVGYAGVKSCRELLLTKEVR